MVTLSSHQMLIENIKIDKKWSRAPEAVSTALINIDILKGETVYVGNENAIGFKIMLIVMRST